MSTKHTAGPWTVWTDESGQPIARVYTTDGRCIAVMPSEPNDSPEALANARLIVRAVNSHEALLEALKEVVKMLSSPKFIEWQTRFRASDTEWAMVSAMDLREQECRAAIAQATAENAGCDRVDCNADRVAVLEAALKRLESAVTKHQEAITIANLNELINAQDEARAALNAVNT